MIMALTARWSPFYSWFESDYYYPTHLGTLKSSAGSFFDMIFAHIYGARATRERAEISTGR